MTRWGSQKNFMQENFGLIFRFLVGSEEVKKAVVVSEEKIQQRSRRRGQFSSSRFSLPENAQTLAGIAFRAAGKLVKDFPATSKFAGKPFQQGISDSHSLLEFSDRGERALRGNRNGGLANGGLAEKVPTGPKRALSGEFLLFPRGCEVEKAPIVIDLLMGLFRGAVFHRGGVPENSPLTLMGRFPFLMGRFLTLMGRFPVFCP